MEYEIKPQGKFSLNLREFWDYKELIYFFAWRDIKVKYKQTALGIMWVALQPLIMMIIANFVFGKVMNNQNSTVPYSLIAYSGLMMWTLFSTSLSGSADSMVSNANIIKKIYFPRLVIPVSSIVSSLVDFIITFILFIGLLFWYQPIIEVKNMIFIPLAVILTIFSALGLGLLLSALNVKYRDFRYLLPFLLQVMLFASPVFYSTSSIDSDWANLIAINPMVAPLTLIRLIFTNTPVNFLLLSISICSEIVLFIVGVYAFKSAERYFADFI